jgi:hypothetical protein
MPEQDSWNIAQVVQCLPSKGKALSSNSSTAKRKKRTEQGLLEKSKSKVDNSRQHLNTRNTAMRRDEGK